MFGLLLRSELLQGSAVRTWNCVLNIANFFRYKFTNFRQPVMPRSRRRHHSRSRSRSRSHSHERDREAKRRRVESPDRRSVSADNEATPQKNMSPMQLKKMEERNKFKLEREELRRKEREEKEEQKRKEREEKEDQKRKEREEKEQLRKKEKEEKEEQKRKEREEKEEQKRKEREEKEEQKRKEREEKESQKKKEREEKEEQKRKEREQKELKRQQELDEKNRDKKKKEEQIEKEKAKFVNFFVARKSASASDLKKPEEEMAYAFIPFEVKSDMRVAPVTRTTLTDEQKDTLTDKISTQNDKVLYLDEIKKGKTIGRYSCTWPVEDDTDVVIIEDTDIGEHVEEQPKVEKMRAKLLKFHENRRPAYFGTWRKTSKTIHPRKPLALDKEVFDYEVDSDDDWEEEEPGESLHGSDDEDKENESEDYEVDNEFFVPHGYLSDEEVEEEENQVMTPETHKEKLKLLQIEFDEEMKSKTERIKPRLIGCIWDNKLIPKVQDAIHKFLEDRMMIFSGSITIQKRDLINTSVKLSASKQITPNRKQLTKELIPDFLQLIHGNTNNQNLLITEFLNYISSKDLDITMNKSSLSSQLKQFAKWRKCPEEGAMFNKHCWYVEEEVRNQYNLNLDLPNKWSYVGNAPEENTGAKKKLLV